MPEKSFYILEGIDEKALPAFQALCAQSPVKDALEERGIIVCARGDDKGRQASSITIKAPAKAGEVIDMLLRVAGTEKAITVGDYMLDKRQNQLIPSDNGRAIQLTEKEAAILSLLAQAKGETVSRQDLLEKVWDYNAAVETQTLETHIYRLRKKIELNPSEPELLMTKEGGYCLTV